MIGVVSTGMHQGFFKYNGILIKNAFDMETPEINSTVPFRELNYNLQLSMWFGVIGLVI